MEKVEALYLVERRIEERGGRLLIFLGLVAQMAGQSCS